jgi:hypothetical protein
MQVARAFPRADRPSSLGHEHVSFDLTQLEHGPGGKDPHFDFFHRHCTHVKVPPLPSDQALTGIQAVVDLVRLAFGLLFVSAISELSSSDVALSVL